MQQTLFLMVGYPGSGKTTVAQIINDQTGAEHIWVDHERQQMFGSQTQSSQASIELYRALNRRAEDFLRAGKSVVYDTNFRFSKDRNELRRIADEAGAQTITIWVTTDRETSRKRATELSDNAPNRFFGNISPEDFDRVTNFLQEPADDEHVIKLDGTRSTPQDVAEALRNARVL